ncbi:MAG: oxidoreductase [Promethearchaeota archaeon]
MSDETGFPLLFSPLKIGTLELQNRIIMPAMHMGYADGGYINDRIIEFYKVRATSEIGLIIIGGCYVNKYGMGIPSMIGIDDDKYIPRLSDFAREIHEVSNTKVCAQLYHSGRYSFKQVIGTQPISSSDSYSSFSKQEARGMTVEEIKQQVADFASAAGRAKKAGFDAVEICGSAGYLIDQFMSPLVNKRTDEYGGPLENRLRFPLEVIKACKDVLGNDVPLLMRYSGSDLVPGSNTLEDKVEIAPYLIKAGLDALNVTGGWHESRVPSITMNVPAGTYTYFSWAIKGVSKVPVFASNRINQPTLAESIIREGKADAVCIGRGQICDPEFSLKARGGRVSEIRACIGCNQGCFDAVFNLAPVTCMRNPVAGMEAKYRLEKASEPKKIMIVGGGPAGLECARVAAIRGHDVSLFEKKSRLGGQIWLAGAPPGRSDITSMVDWYSSELSRLGVKVHLSVTVDASVVSRVQPDEIVIATGARPVKPPIPGVDLPGVHFAWDFLEPGSKIVPGRRCAVIGGGATGIEAAISLASYGAFNPDVAAFLNYYDVLDDSAAWLITRHQRKVYILEMTSKLGSNFGKSTRWVMLQDLKKHDVESINNSKVNSISSQADGKLRISFTVGDEDFNLKDLHSVYLATSIKSESSLADELKAGYKVHKIGDARKTKDLMEAISAGFKKGRRL